MSRLINRKNLLAYKEIEKTERYCFIKKLSNSVRTKEGKLSNKNNYLINFCCKKSSNLAKT